MPDTTKAISRLLEYAAWLENSAGKPCTVYAFGYSGWEKLAADIREVVTALHAVGMSRSGEHDSLRQLAEIDDEELVGPAANGYEVGYTEPVKQGSQQKARTP